MTEKEIDKEELRLEVQYPDLAQSLPEGMVRRVIESYDEIMGMATDYMLFGKICRDISLPIIRFKALSAPKTLSAKGFSVIVSDKHYRVSGSVSIWMESMEYDGPVDPYRLGSLSASSELLKSLGITIDGYFRDCHSTNADRLRYYYPNSVDGSNALDNAFAGVGVMFSDSVSVIPPNSIIPDTVDRIESGMIRMDDFKDGSRMDRDVYENHMMLIARAAIEYLDENGFGTEFDPDPERYGIVRSRDPSRPPDLK